jgi:acetoin utilization deacetylase AcuC-like enzyme
MPRGGAVVDDLLGFSDAADDRTRLGRRIAGPDLLTVFMLEGGYATSELGINAAAVVDGFESLSKPDPGQTPRDKREELAERERERERDSYRDRTRR